MRHPMRLELIRVGLLVYLANHYTTWGAQNHSHNSKMIDSNDVSTRLRLVYTKKLWNRFHSE